MQSKDIYRYRGPERTDRNGSRMAQYFDLTIKYSKKPESGYHPRGQEHKLALTDQEKAIAEAAGVSFEGIPYDAGLGVYLLPRGGIAARGSVRALKGHSKETRPREVTR